MGNDWHSFRNRSQTVTQSQSTFRRTATKELALFVGFLALGLLLLPIAIYFVGQQVFGTYGGAGFSDFFNTLSGQVREGNWVVWFLVLAPYLGWQTIRLTRILWRAAGSTQGNKTTA